MPSQKRGRPLEPAERRVLDFMLSIDVSGHQEGAIRALQDQAGSVRVAERWECCPSVTFVPSVDGPWQHNVIIESRHRHELIELLLFASADGELGWLEIVHYAEDTLGAFPSIDEFDRPALVRFPDP